MSVSTYTPDSTKILHTTYADFVSRQIGRPVHVVQYDDGLPLLAVKLFSDGQPYTIPSNADINIKLGKSDGKFVYNPALGCDSFRHTAYFEITYQMAVLSGEVSPVIEILIGTSVSASSPIGIIIDRNSVQKENIESTSEWKAIASSVEYAKEAIAAAANASASRSAAKTSETNAKTSETNAKTSETNARTSETNAKISEQNIKGCEDICSEYAQASRSYAIGDTDYREGERADNAKYYYQQAKQISEGLAGSLFPMGTIPFSDLSIQPKVAGYMYNILDGFISDNTFKDGGGIKYPAGTNVYYTADGYWDCLAGASEEWINNAYNQANSAYARANTAYNQANAAYNQANSAYARANTANTAAGNAYARANTAYNQANSAYARANTAYNQANAAYNQANAAYNQANSAYTEANTAYNRVNASKLALGASANASGTYSVALGESAIASGSFGTTALGTSAKASGNYSLALGYSTNASGGGGTALGALASASGGSGTALGASAKASGNYSVALGHLANASGGGGTALGEVANVSGNYSVALGASARASGNYSVALGYDAVVAETKANTIQLGNASHLSALSCKVALTVTSDERDKTDITYIEDGAVRFLKKIHAIRYVFNHREMYIDEENLSNEEREKKEKYGLCVYDKESHAKGTKKGSRIRVGVSAQETLKALQEIYGDSSYANLINDNLFDINPSEIPEGVENQLSANYEGFIPFLIKAVQELDRRLEALEAKERMV